MTPVYFIVGSPGSGRRSVAVDLIENGLPEDDPVLVLLATTEQPAPADARLGMRKNVTIARWSWTPPVLPSVSIPAGATVFFLADSQASPLDQIEALKPWLEQHDAELARIFCFVDCQLAARHPVLKQWFAACIHFADVVFLTKREGVANKWLSDFINLFKDEYFPCHFVQVKNKGHLASPAVLLDPSPRRVSQYFEEGESYEIEGLETDDDAGEDGDTGLLPAEPYFVRDASGRREKEVPDLNDFLDRSV